MQLDAVRNLFAMTLLLACAACATTPAEAPAMGQFVERSLALADGAHRYQVFVPARGAGGIIGR